MDIGDVVLRKSYEKDVAFKVIDIRHENGEKICILKGIDIRIIADSPEHDLEKADSQQIGQKDEVFNKKVKESIDRILMSRSNQIIDGSGLTLKNKKVKKNDLYFGRSGTVLHLDGDGKYLEICMKAYKRIGINAIGNVIPESEQPSKVVDLVKKYKPDIVVITGHDGMFKDAKDYMDLSNYKNSKYFVESVKRLRNYQLGYDDLIIFAGACQSCYEAILGAGANFASSPNRVLIHCLDPVFVCEKIAYTNIEKVVQIEEAIENTITGIKGIGGLQTRGKYRMGFPRSLFI